MNHNQNAGELPEEVKKAIEAEINLRSSFCAMGMSSTTKLSTRMTLEAGARIGLAHSHPVHNAGEVEERMREAVNSNISVGGPCAVFGQIKAAKACTAICHDHNAALRAEVKRLRAIALDAAVELKAYGIKSYANKVIASVTSSPTPDGIKKDGE